MAIERTARIDRIHHHTSDTRSLFLTLDEPLAFRAGQFISCLLPVGGERLIRPYSIASAPNERQLEILYDLVPTGAGSQYLHGLREGDPLVFTGPWGTFTVGELPNAETVLIAENTGIAPIRSILDAHHRDAHGPLHLLYGTTLGIYFDQLARLPGVTGTMVPCDRLLAETKRRYVDADADRTRHFFICGVGPLVYTLRDLLRGAGYARRAVQYEKW